MESDLRLELFIDKSQEGRYLTLPFTMPSDTESFVLSYHYQRHQEAQLELDQGQFTSRQESNIIDLGLIANDGSQVGASGSELTTFTISETFATPGYRPCALVPGKWQILVGACKVGPAGVAVRFDLTFMPKHLRLFKGDLHTHTLASDGVLSVAELGQHAVRHGLDYLAITDHNHIATTESLPRLAGLTLIPGVEWTHFQGHANFLGVDRPYDEPFFSNDFEGVQARFQSARECGALITINHPFEEVCPFQFDIHALPFDCLEVWNGPMRVANLQAVGLWQQLLAAGKKIPICGGSDYHRDRLFIFLGGPTTCIYAPSPGPSDLLSSLRQGHAYLTFAPDGPSLEMTAGDAMIGDSVPFPAICEIQFKAGGLRAGDVINMITAGGSTPILEAEHDGEYRGAYTLDAPGFARIEIWRSFIPGVPQLPALISNPIYFDAA